MKHFPSQPWTTSEVALVHSCTAGGGFTSAVDDCASTTQDVVGLTRCGRALGYCCAGGVRTNAVRDMAGLLLR